MSTTSTTPASTTALSTATAVPTPTTPAATSSVRVLSVPAAHPYVVAISADPRLTLLADPPVPGVLGGQWWPPQALLPEWITQHADDADILHIHFGTESFEPEQLDAALDAAKANGWPVVYTVHDLEHPQLAEQHEHDSQLDVLVARADAVLTLTDAAADEIRRRWHRDAEVVPHPHLLGADVLLLDSEPNDPAVIGVALKDLRPNIDAVAVTHAVIAATQELTDAGIPARAEIRMHTSVRDAETRDAVRRLAAGSDVTLIEHERLDDDQLAHVLAGLDVAVLPYAHGTHSGWLELCWDLAVPVAVPPRGYYAQQHPDATVAVFEDGELACTIATLLRGPRAGSAERTLVRAQRRGERSRVDNRTAQRHAELYLRLLADRPRS